MGLNFSAEGRRRGENRFQNRNGDPCGMRPVAVPFRRCFGIDFARRAARIGRLYHGLESRRQTQNFSEATDKPTLG